MNKDPNGETPLFGALFGIGVDIASQLIMMKMGLQDEFNWSSVLISGITGAVGVGIGEKVAKIGTLAGSKLVNTAVSTAADVAANTALGVAEDVVKDALDNGKIDSEIDIQSNVLGAVVAKGASAAAEKVADQVFDNAKEVAQLEKKLQSAEQKVRNNPKKSPNTNRNRNVQEAKEALENTKSKKVGRVAQSSIVAGAPGGVAKEANKQRKTGTNPACFIAGTLISTSEGLKNIEDIRKGDKLFTRNELTGELNIDIVLNTIESSAKELYHLLTSDGCQIVVTPQHSFFINNGVWVTAKQLKVDDVLWTTDKKVQISSINTRKMNRNSIPVYNLEMTNNHNYYVSECGILVHNAETEPPRAPDLPPVIITK
jgi:hypothetical protein